MISYALIIACVLVIAAGQLLFKSVGMRMGENGFSVLLTDRRAAILFLVAITAYGVATFGWVYALRTVPLSRAYLFMSFSFILVPVMSWVVLGEPVTSRLAIGALLIVSGVLVAASAPA